MNWTTALYRGFLDSSAALRALGMTERGRGALAGAPRPSFDGILIAQELAHNLVLISIEGHFGQYGVRHLW